MAKLVLPQAEGKAAVMYFFTPSGPVIPVISMCSASQPSCDKLGMKKQVTQLSFTLRAIAEPSLSARHFLPSRELPPYLYRRMIVQFC